VTNVYCVQKQHSPDGTSEMCTVHRKKQFPDTTSEMCTVHRNRTHSRQCIRNVHVHNRTLSRWYIRNVYCAQKQNTFQIFTSEMCTVHKNRTLSRWYTYTSIYKSQNNTKKCNLAISSHSNTPPYAVNTQ